MEKIIKNRWREQTGGVERASILQRDVHPEGLDASRVRLAEQVPLHLDQDSGHLLTVFSGQARLSLGEQSLHLESGTHVYLPSGSEACLEAAQASAEFVLMSAPASQAVGTRVLVRDERFLRACSVEAQSLRWILTPQYLSRRVFLHHDSTLVSKTGHPVSWFHTTMFDVDGLPHNAEGESVFKMSYNHRTEFNICVEVEGQAAFRSADHPYGGETWAKWRVLDGETSYYLNETKAQAELHGNEPMRNKHEIRVAQGHVDLFCLFDPAPTGVEQHRSGDYSDYGPLSETIGTDAYQRYTSQLAPLDQMVDHLSHANAAGEENIQSSAEWSRYEQGLASQRKAEEALYQRLKKAGHGRERILKRWMIA